MVVRLKIFWSNIVFMSLHIIWKDHVPTVPPTGQVTEISERVEKILRLQESSNQSRKEFTSRIISRTMQRSRYNSSISKIQNSRQRMFRTNSGAQLPAETAKNRIKQSKEDHWKTGEDGQGYKDSPSFDRLWHIGSVCCLVLSHWGVEYERRVDENTL